MKYLLQKYSDYQRDVLLFSKDHRKHNYCDIKKLIEYLEIRGVYSIEDLKMGEILDYFSNYKNTVIDTGPNKGKLPSQNALSGKANSIKQFFKFCAMLGIRLNFNWEQLPKIQKEKKTRDMMNKQEYEILRSAPYIYEENPLIAERNQIMIDIPYKMGLRRCEILRCKFDDFKNKNRQFMIKGKGGYIDPCFFTEELSEKIIKFGEALESKYSRKFEFVISGLNNKNLGKAMSEVGIDNIVKGYSDKLLEAGKINRHLTLHMERHSFATNCVYSGLSQQATQQLMRHKDPKTTIGYYHLNSTWLCSQFDKINTY